MFDYLKQFKSLPKELRERVSSPMAMSILAELEEKYKVNLASVIMKVMVKTLSLTNLPTYFSTEFSLDPESAKKLTKELEEKIFFSVAAYLGLKPSFKREENQANEIIKEANLSFSNNDLKNRCLKVITSYLRGVRSKIDTRSALEKSLESGGLGLEKETVDNILKICFSYIAKDGGLSDSAIPPAPTPSPSLAPTDALDKIIKQHDFKKEDSYDLKKEIKEGRTPSLAPVKEFKKIPPTEDLKEISSPDSPLLLEEKNEEKKERKEEEIVKLEVDKEEDLPIAPLAPKKEDKEEEKKIDKEEERREKEKEEKQKKEKEEKEKEKSEEERREKEKTSFAPPPKKGIINKLFKTKKRIDISPDLKSSLDKKEEKEKEKKEEQKNEEEKKDTKKGLAMKEVEIKKEIKPRAVSDSGSKTKMEDIKVAPKVMGPIDELRYLDLINFRRLGENADEITKKIKSKIDLLEKNGFDQKVKAILAWKKSPVSRTYVSIGQEAIKRGKSIKEVAEERLSEDSRSLSWDEIKAIIALNSSFNN